MVRVRTINTPKGGKKITDLVSRIRQEQVVLSKRYAHHLFREIRSDLDNHNPSSVNEYLMEPIRLADNLDSKVNWGNADIKTLKVLAESELGNGMHVSVLNYTNYIVAKMVNDHEFTLPLTTELNFDYISSHFGVKPKMLERAVLFMHSEYKLPLLGKIRKGKFNPNPKELREYASLMYGWEKDADGNYRR